MTAGMNALVAAEHVADLRRAGDRRRATPSSPGQGHAPGVELRLADARDADIVRRLAALDDARELDGSVLLALVDDDAAAALSLRDGRVVANPFVPTDHVVALLRLRAEHLSRAPAPRRLRRLPRLRLV